MIGIELLPGLLDESDYQLPSLPASRADVYIAPLRNPGPPQSVQVRSSFESLARISGSGAARARKGLHLEENIGYVTTQTSGTDKKKPHLAISELVDTTQIIDTQQTQLPSFVSLSAVERSPVPPPSYINLHKRLRLDLDSETAHHEVNRLLPRPATKDDKKARPVPLLPAMVTGLHEPPPSAGLLPSMDLDAPPERTRNPTSKLQVKDILSEPVQPADRRPPEAMINSPELGTILLSRAVPDVVPSQRHEPEKENNSEQAEKIQAQVHDIIGTKQSKPNKTSSTSQKPASKPEADTKSKSRRQRRIWTDEETLDLLSGVAKHGVGRWVNILADPTYNFNQRTSVDLKDRYRVYPKDKDNNPLSITSAKQPNLPNERTKHQPQSQISSEQRRKRTTWTEPEDQALIKGITTHGFKWTAIQEDPDLSFGHRRPLDLKDHARHLIPGLYKNTPASKPVKSHAGRGQAESTATNSGSLETSESTEKEAMAMNRKNEKQVAHAQGQALPSEHAGVTLPRLDLDDDLDWDNTLPPLLDWEELEM